jgi:ureidoacrylate peracid hydrolase
MNAAVIVVDMQNGYVHREGSIARLGSRLYDIDAVIERHVALLAEARRLGLPIVYTRHLHRADYLDAPTLATREMARIGAVVEGTWDAEVLDSIAPHPGVVVVNKRRYDAFLYTDMEVMLRMRQVGSVLITGVATHACVESTARGADMRDLRVAVAADCTASTNREIHEASLRMMAALGMTVAPWREALAAIADGAVAAPAGRLAPAS